MCFQTNNADPNCNKPQLKARRMHQKLAREEQQKKKKKETKEKKNYQERKTKNFELIRYFTVTQHTK